MKVRARTYLVIGGIFLSLAAGAAEFTSFKVVSAKGTVLAKAPGASVESPIEQGKRYPFGTVVKTGRKSSAVLAGLIPQLQDGAIDGSETWHYYPRLVPGSDPLRNLALLLQPSGINTSEWVQETTFKFRQNPHHLITLVNQNKSKPTVLIIDQFEELFANVL